MTDTQIIEAALAEIKKRTFALTRQYLEVHEVLSIDGEPVIERIDREEDDGTAIVYLPVKEEKFYLAIYVDTRPTVAVRWIGTEPYNRVYFRATSETMELEALKKITSLVSTEGWNKGDKKRYGDAFYKFSSVTFLPNPEPDAIEDKLKKLLDFLEQDREGVKRLIDEADGYIQVAMEFHNGNGMIGGPHLDKEMIRRMSELHLEIDFDLYIGGKPFRD